MVYKDYTEKDIMKFEHDKTAESIGKVAGYILACALFSAVLFFILSFLNRIPSSWTYIHVLGLSFAVVFFGEGLKRWLR